MNTSTSYVHLYVHKCNIMNKVELCTLMSKKEENPVHCVMLQGNNFVLCLHLNPEGRVYFLIGCYQPLCATMSMIHHTPDMLRISRGKPWPSAAIQVLLTFLSMLAAVVQLKYAFSNSTHAYVRQGSCMQLSRPAELLAAHGAGWEKAMPSGIILSKKLWFLRTEKKTNYICMWKEQNRNEDACGACIKW